MISAFCCTLSMLIIVAAAAATPTTRPAADATGRVSWLNSLDAAYLQAQRTNQPILLLVDDEPSSSTQASILRSAGDGWVLVRLDPSESRVDIRVLGVVSVPSLCVLSPAGRVLEIRQDGLDDASLALWLHSMHERTTTQSSLAILSQGQSLADLASQDETARRLAVRHLSGDRAAVSRVVDLLFDGSLSARLAALDALEQWGAPVTGIDPWNPQTLNRARHAALANWALAAEPATQPSAPGSSDLEVELDTLVNAATEFQARAIREQVISFGPQAMPAIRRRLDANASDAARQRLTALRYRLVASDRLAIQWPGGFDCLASADPFVRRSAVDQLSQKITDDDSALVVELFSDKDEFVRERSLRMLRGIAGTRSTRALIQLLNDPEPNVRAAVLKAMAENPDASLVPDLARYAQTETDPDLVVHCIGVLKAINGDGVIDCLVDLLNHSAWRVRAEACDAIHDRIQSRQLTDPHQIAVVVEALKKCLDDSDDFVVSQAAIALVAFDLALPNQAVTDAMQRHPSLGLDVLDSLARNHDSAVMLIPGIRRLASNPSPQVRAAAIRAVCQYAPSTAGAQVSAGLSDPDPIVRQEAATGLATAIERMFPQNGQIYADPGNDQSTAITVQVSQWVSNFAIGIGRPDWMTGLKPTLEKMLASPDEQTRVAVAMSLCALGDVDRAWPVLLNSAHSELARGTEAAALPWLDWDRRKLLWDRLVAITPDGQMPRLIDQFSAVPDERAIPSLWAVLCNPPRDTLLRPVHDALTSLYNISNLSTVNGVVDNSGTNPSIEKAITDSKMMCRQGGELQKVEALCLLCNLAPADAARAAAAIYRNKFSSGSLRVDALKILLLSQPKDQSDPVAVEAVSDPVLRKTAVAYLASGYQNMMEIRLNMYINSSAQFNSGEVVMGQGRIMEVSVPAGLTPEPLVQLLTDEDSDTAGYAGYLLAILGNHRGLAPLLAAWQAHGTDDNEWQRLTYRAIAKLDDDSQTPTLEKIYGAMRSQTWQIREFYWTVRAMHGPNILKLRKRIRDEVGMQQLQ